MLKRYGERAFDESGARAEEFASTGDHNGEAVWRAASPPRSSSLRTEHRQARCIDPVGKGRETSPFIRLTGQGRGAASALTCPPPCISTANSQPLAPFKG